MVVHPPFAWQLGSLICILSLALQLALVVRSSCGFSSTVRFRTFAMGSPLQGRGWEVLDRNEGRAELYSDCWLFLRDEVTLWVETVVGLILERSEEFLTFYLVVEVLRDGVTLSRVEFTTWAHSLDRNEGLLSEPCPRPFGMRSPRGSSGWW